MRQAHCYLRRSRSDLEASVNSAEPHTLAPDDREQRRATPESIGGQLGETVVPSGLGVANAATCTRREARYGPGD
jgi:hypothetical protein